MPTSFDAQVCLQSSLRMDCTGILEKDSYSLCHFAVTSLLRARGNAKSDGMTNRADCLYSLHEGLQLLSIILQKLMELPFVVPKYFFRVRYIFCFSALIIKYHFDLLAFVSWLRYVSFWHLFDNLKPL